MADEMAALSEQETSYEAEIHKRMLVIPNLIDPAVPIGRDDTENVERERFGEPRVPDYPVPYHVDIMEALGGIDLDSARKTSGNGFYYLMGDVARLHSAVLSYARDFMIDRGFTYCIPPYMIRGGVVDGVMSFSEMENMMYKIEGEDLYLIGTSEHSMIGKFIDTILDEAGLPQTLTSYSPCFRKEVGAHGIEERGVYRIHQFEKQEMIVVCKPEDSAAWFDRLWQNSVAFFRTARHPRAHDRVLLRRPRRPQGAQRRRRSLVAAPAEVFRGRLLLQPRRRAGAPPRHPHPQPRQGQLFCPHAQQHRRRAAAHADRLPRKQPATGWQRPHPRGAPPVYGRQGRSLPRLTPSSCFSF